MTGDKTYPSVVDLMNGLRFAAIREVTRNLLREEVRDPRYGRVSIMDPDDPYIPPPDTISVYIDIEGFMEAEDFGSGDRELLITARLTDHKSLTMKAGTVRRGNRVETTILADVGDSIVVSGGNGVECMWNSLDRARKLPLIRGVSARLKDGRVIEPPLAFSIARSAEGGIANDIRRKAMDAIHSFFSG